MIQTLITRETGLQVIQTAQSGLMNLSSLMTAMDAALLEDDEKIARDIALSFEAIIDLVHPWSLLVVTDPPDLTRDYEWSFREGDVWKVSSEAKGKSTAEMLSHSLQCPDMQYRYREIFTAENDQ
jgi:hypothetical protein